MTAPNPAVAFHSDTADQFLEKYATHPDFLERLAVWTAALHRYIHAGDQVIDWGCGPGVFSLLLAQRRCRVIGLDGAENMIAIARRTATAHKLDTASFEQRQLPLEAIPDDWIGTQDAVISSSVLEYLTELDTATRQMSRLVKPGGHLLVSVPNRPSIFRRLERTSYRLTRRPSYCRFVKHQFAPAELHDLWRRRGFTLRETAFYGGNNRVTRLTDMLVPEPWSKTLFLSIYQKTSGPQSS